MPANCVLFAAHDSHGTGRSCDFRSHGHAVVTVPHGPPRSQPAISRPAGPARPVVMTIRLPPFDEVVEAHGRDVWRFCASQVGPDRADDLFQDTMLAALRAYPSLRDPGATRSWLFRIAARTAIDLFRATARAPVPVDRLPETAASPPPEPRDDDVWERARALPPKQRQAVALRFALDLDYAGIAEAMETTPEAARRNVFEALRALRAAISRESPPERLVGDTSARKESR